MATQAAKIAVFLADHGADVMHKDHKNRSPLDLITDPVESVRTELEAYQTQPWVFNLAVSIIKSYISTVITPKRCMYAAMTSIRCIYTAMTSNRCIYTEYHAYYARKRRLLWYLNPAITACAAGSAVLKWRNVWPVRLSLNAKCLKVSVSDWTRLGYIASVPRHVKS